MNIQPSFFPVVLQHMNTSTLSDVISKCFSCLWIYNWNFIKKDADIQNFSFSSVLSISTLDLIDKPQLYLHVNSVMVSQMVRPKSVSPEVLEQEQFACNISLIFLIFLKHNPPINFS